MRLSRSNAARCQNHVRHQPPGTLPASAQGRESAPPPQRVRARRSAPVRSVVGVRGARPRETRLKQRPARCQTHG